MITIPKNIPNSVALIAMNLNELNRPSESPLAPLVSRSGGTEADALGVLVTKLPATAVEAVVDNELVLSSSTSLVVGTVLVTVVLTGVVAVEQSVQEVHDVHSSSQSLLSHVPLDVQPGQSDPGHLSSGHEPEPHGPAVPVGQGPLSYQVCVPLVLQ
ncbi:hypothetical protein ACEPPN_010183 [Leptodophora sp. 'Broadleaf-Isolate-01']